jgi:hypothetical protein
MLHRLGEEKSGAGAVQYSNQRIQAVTVHFDWAEHQVEAMIVEQRANFLVGRRQLAFASTPS